jgi:hypothetical protein
MRRPNERDRYPTVGTVAGELAWADVMYPEELADVLRSTLRKEYADASDEEMADALENVLDSMSAAEAFNVGSALRQIGNSAGKLASDPTFAQIVRTAAPAAGGMLGTFIGGPLGTAVGTQLGNLAVKALPPAPGGPPPSPPATAPPTPPAAPPPAVPSALAVSAAVASAEPPSGGPAAAALSVPARQLGEPAAPPVTAPAPSGGASPVAGGSAAAARALVLAQQGDMLRGLIATAFGQPGRREISGVPVAQLLTLFSQVVGQAAADADELAYLEQQPEAAEYVIEEWSPGSAGALYADLLGADNLEFAEAIGWEELD